MKFRSMEEVAAYLSGVIDERMAANIKAMRADGLTSEQITDALPTLIEHAELVRALALDHAEHVMRAWLDVDVVTHSIN
jgi:hypothetical protein